MALKISNLDRVERLRIGSIVAGTPQALGTLSVEGAVTSGAPTTFAAQTGDIAATEITGTDVVASYRISYVLELTSGSPSAAAYVTLTLAWTGDAGATTDAVRILFTGASYNSVVCRTASGYVSVAVAITGTYDSAVYTLRCHAERLN